MVHFLKGGSAHQYEARDTFSARDPEKIDNDPVIN